MKNLIQYASFLVAVGCELNFDTATAQLEIASIPPNKKKIIEDAVADIGKFLDTANFTDGMAALPLANLVNGFANPLDKTQRMFILNALGIMRGDKFIASVMMQAKSNRSWHVSDEPNTCTQFGVICTHRGITIDPKKRGIRSNRSPEEYHVKLESGIKREQLITPALEAAYDLIPDSVLITAKATNGDIEHQIELLTPEQLDEFIRKMQKRREAVNANN